MPELPRPLAEVADVVGPCGWAIELLDPQWRLVWVSDSIADALGAAREDLGIGRFILEARELPAWRDFMHRDRYLDALREFAPVIAHDVDDLDGQLAGLPEEVRSVFDGVEPSEPGPMWTTELAWVQGNMPQTPVRIIGARLTRGGEFIGTAAMYGPDLPAPLLALVARGHRALFERMAELLEPERRPAAIAFADLESSGTLSRHLPTPAYFDLIRAVTTAIDERVIELGGIVGKHAGDGVTAFFVADQVGSDSAAARAAIEAGRAISAAAREAAEELAAGDVPVEPDEVLVNVGLHWGGGLYMGQVVTGGRLEVTALGDEVNEAARIEQSATDGAVLASKSLIERLSGEDADALGIAPDRLRYTSVAELEGASEKALRDAGAIAVTDVRAGGDS